MKNPAQMHLNPLDGFVDVKSILLISTTFLLDAVTANPILPYLTLVSVCLGIVYHMIKISLELYKAYDDHKGKKKKRKDEAGI